MVNKKQSPSSRLKLLRVSPILAVAATEVK